MKVGLLTDAPKHNLALMKLSAYHKKNGDDVSLNMPILKSDYRYASILFEKNINNFIADEYGGIAYVSMRLRNQKSTKPCCEKNRMLPQEIEYIKPDYSLFNLDFSLGYTYRPCSNLCAFCKVPTINHPDIDHHSIFEFHDPKFNKICLLNNNTFQDQKWKETFNEIWDTKLTVIDENGYDLRLIDDEKAEALKRTKFQGKIHFAWDRIQDEALIKYGLNILNEHKLRGNRVYVLIGYDTTEEEDIHRCEVIRSFGQDPYIMPYNGNKAEKRFKRFIDTFMWRKYKTIKEAWINYSG